MKTTYFFLALSILSSHAMQKGKRKRVSQKQEGSQEVIGRQYPYCQTHQENLSDHFLNEHNIDQAVLPECLVAITAFNAIKNSRYDIADIPCTCNSFFRSHKSILKHQNSKYSCPARCNAHSNSHESAETIQVKIESPAPESQPTRSRRVTRASSKTEEFIAGNNCRIFHK